VGAYFEWFDWVGKKKCHCVCGFFIGMPEMAEWARRRSVA
jgi:hypothetical protein